MGALKSSKEATQLMTFYLGEDLYGIEVLNIQEVTGVLPVEQVPLAPKFIKGLINLRGQIATALDLREVFLISHDDSNRAQASVVCQLNGNLVSLLVDSLGDVVASNQELEELAPQTLSPNIKKYLKGVSKRDESILCIIDLGKLSNELNINVEQQ